MAKMQKNFKRKSRLWAHLCHPNFVNKTIQQKNPFVKHNDEFVTIS